MKNYEQFIRMLRAANIAFTAKPDGAGTIVNLSAASGPSNEGYGGLYTSFRFNEHGELDTVGVWEEAKAA